MYSYYCTHQRAPVSTYSHTPTKTMEHIVSTQHCIVYITVARVWQHLTKLVFQIQEKIKPTFIFCHVSTSRQSCVTAQLLLHRIRRRLNSLEVFHHYGGLLGPFHFYSGHSTSTLLPLHFYSTSTLFPLYVHVYFILLRVRDLSAQYVYKQEVSMFINKQEA